MGEWKKSRLGDYIKVKHGFAFPGKYITTEETDDILVTPGNFNIGGGFKNAKMKYFKGEYPDEYILKYEDIIVTMTDLSKETDTLGYSAKIPKNDNKRYLHNQRIGLIQFKNDDIDKEFLYWLMRTREYHWYIVGSASGTSIMHTSPTRIEDYTCTIPPLQEQKTIAEVLSSLDDKIDLLHRQNQTLEALAQTLFRQWFIEEAGDEWVEKPLSKIATFLNGLACQKFPPQNDVDKLPVLKIKDLKAGISDSSDWATTEVKPEYIIKNGDVIFAWSASLMVKIWDGGKCILNQHLFKVTSEKYPKWFYYQWCKYHLDRFIAIAQAHATTMGHIKRKDLDNAMCFIPSDEELEIINRQMILLMEKMENNSRQIKTLENMRNTLLPKLMSGEVRVKYG